MKTSRARAHVKILCETCTYTLTNHVRGAIGGNYKAHRALRYAQRIPKSHEEERI